MLLFTSEMVYLYSLGYSCNSITHISSLSATGVASYACVFNVVTQRSPFSLNIGRQCLSGDWLNWLTSKTMGKETLASVEQAIVGRSVA